jgi:hypothetical protein
VKISIVLEASAPTKKYPVEARKTPLEDTIRECVDCIESGHDSVVEWKTLNKLYKELRARKKTPRVTNLIKMIEPTLQKYGLHGVSEEK